jgi:hypothetical protein
LDIQHLYQSQPTTTQPSSSATSPLLPLPLQQLHQQQPFSTLSLSQPSFTLLQPSSTLPQPTPPAINVIDYGADCEAGPIADDIPLMEKREDEEDEEDED